MHWSHPTLEPCGMSATILLRQPYSHYARLILAIRDVTRAQTARLQFGLVHAGSTEYKSMFRSESPAFGIEMCSDEFSLKHACSAILSSRSGESVESSWVPFPLR